MFQYEYVVDESDTTYIIYMLRNMTKNITVKYLLPKPLQRGKVFPQLVFNDHVYHDNDPMNTKLFQKFNEDIKEYGMQKALKLFMIGHSR